MRQSIWQSCRRRERRRPDCSFTGRAFSFLSVYLQTLTSRIIFQECKSNHLYISRVCLRVSLFFSQCAHFPRIPILPVTTEPVTPSWPPAHLTASSACSPVSTSLISLGVYIPDCLTWTLDLWLFASAPSGSVCLSLAESTCVFLGN